MKKLLYSLVLVLFGTTAIAQQNPVDFCYNLAELAEATAVARDKYITPEQSALAMIQGGVPAEIAIAMVDAVYFDGSALSPSQINEVVFQICLEQQLST